LVDLDDLVQVLHSQDLVVRAWTFPGSVVLHRKPRIENVGNQRAFAGAGHTGDRDERPQREIHRDVLEIVLARPNDGQRLAASSAAHGRRNDDS
jgi:hypothetical protein